MIEWIGYIASIVIATSMLMNSLLKLRWINLVGAILFSTYGFIIYKDGEKIGEGREGFKIEVE